MGRLKIDTSTSLFEPIEIEIDGVVYPIQKMDAVWLGKFDAYDKKMNKGDYKAGVKFLNELIGVPIKVAETVDIKDIVQIEVFIASENKELVFKKNLIEPKKETIEAMETGIKEIKKSTGEFVERMEKEKAEGTPPVQPTEVNDKTESKNVDSGVEGKKEEKK